MTRIVRLLLLGAALAVVVATPARAQDPEHPEPVHVKPDPGKGEQPPDIEEPAPDSSLAIGDRAPAFELEGTGAATVRLADLRGHAFVLAFDASRTRLGALALVADTLRTAGLATYGVCGDDVGLLRRYAASESLAVTLLADPGAEVAKAFGCWAADRRAIRSTLVLVDARGVVRALATPDPLLPADLRRFALQAFRPRPPR